MSFAHLHLHTEYSIIDSHATIAGYLKRAKELGQDTMAITDHGVMSGAIEFYTKAREMEIKPIIGCEIYVDYDYQGKGERDQHASHLTVLARNEAGYRSLIAFQRAAHTKKEHTGYYYKPRLWLEEAVEYMQDWFVFSGCMSSPISRLILDDRMREAVEVARYIDKAAYGFYVEMMSHDPYWDNDYAEKAPRLQAGLEHLARKFKFPIVVTNDCHYVTKESEVISQKFFHDSGDTATGVKLDASGFYMRSRKEMLATGLPREGIDNTLEIADECDVRIPEADKLTWYVPEIAADPVKTLDRKCRKVIGLISHWNQDYTERYKKELSVLRQTPHIAQSYLVAHDLIKWCREQEIGATGRGSMAGSLISWLLEITREDPVKYGLKFERAVNPARPIIPDFDIDVSSSERLKVLAHLAEKYDQACQIGTYVSYGPRGATRMVMRSLNYPYIEMNETSKNIPEEWAAAVPLIPAEIREFVESYRGSLSTSGVHPAGYLISGESRPLDREVPLMWIPSSGVMVSQYDMYSLKKIGLFKLDVLGLKAIDQLGKMAWVTGVAPPDEYDDPAVFQAISDNQVADIFQLEGHSARSVIRDLGGVHDFEDVVVVNTISRPGASQFIGDYKRGDSGLVRKYPQIKETLELTRGVILYQEQLMEICATLADFDDAEQDVLIQAMKRFESGEFHKMTDRFLSGCRKNGVNGKDIWEALLRFAGYAFNRAHAVSYAGFAYRMMWYKVHYPAAFYAAVFDASDHRRELILESHYFGVEWRLPDINKSERHTTAKDGVVLLGLETIKGVGPAAAREIVKRRWKRPYSGLDDLKQRVNRKRCNAKILNILNKMGMFDEPATPEYILDALDFPVAVLNPVMTKRVAVKTANEVGGFVLDVKSHTIKGGSLQGKKMGFMTLANPAGVFKCVLFPDVWRKFRQHVRLEAVILTGQWNDRNDFIVEGGRAIYAKG